MIEPSPSRTGVAFQRLQRRTLDDRDVVAREVVLGQQFAHFHFDQFQQLGIVNHVALVHVDNDVRHTHLTCQQDVLARLRHRAVSRRNHQDRAVHLRRAGNHVLDVVGVTRAVNVRVVTVRRLVFDVRGVDRDAARLLFRRRVNLVVGLRLAAKLLRQNRRDRRRQRRLPMINVPNRAHIYVRLRTFKFSLCHYRYLKTLEVNKIYSTNRWCPWPELNCRPLPYQGSALPLSYMGIARQAINNSAAATWSG